MGLSPNFLKVSVGQDASGKDVVFVHGKTDEKPERVQAIYVALGHGEDLVQPRRGVGANAPVQLQPKGDLETAAKVPRASAQNWSVKIAQPNPKIGPGEKVLVVGVAVRTSRPSPLFWQETLTTEAIA
jgi:hypothetical protein